MFLPALLITICGHIFTEYTLQKTRLGIYKRKSIWGLIIHAFLWTVAMCPGLCLLDLFALWKALFLLATHAIIDYIKMSKTIDKIKIFHPANVIDQLLHFLTVVIVYIK